MQTAKDKSIKTILFISIFLVALSAPYACAGPLPGAIFTTLEDGSRVNANIYQKMEDVYLDGGPGQNAPPGSAALDEGDYYFQVTDPSGKELLSTDPVKCRSFHVNSYGVIDYVIPATCEKKVRGKLQETDCFHNTGIDIDHAELGAITVQLMPYDRTPNKGGVYKVWITPVGKFVGDENNVDNDGQFHGFVPAWSKTDNYKVRRGKPCDPPIIIVKKFLDADANGVWDEDEDEITGWKIYITPPTQETNTKYTPVNIIAMPPGLWTIVEADNQPNQPCDWLQTALYLDGERLPDSNTVEVNVRGECEELHEIIFGNILLGKVNACKFYDRNDNAKKDEGEPPVEGILFLLDGNDVKGDQVHKEGYTDVNGCVTFEGLLPGEYILTEVLPPDNWEATTPNTVTFDLDPNPEDCEEGLTFEFGNICRGQADFSTKGYWHNKNGIGELTANDEVYNDVLNFVHSLNTYDDPSVYYNKGDEPFDGNFADGTPVPAGKGVLENEDIAAEGTKEAEISNFLIESVGDGGIREQLAQQLLAFIFNVHYRIGNDPDVVIYPDGDARSALEIIDCAVLAWSGETDPLCPMGVNETAALLDALNNSDAVDYVSTDSCPVIYGSTFRNFAGMATSWGSADCVEENNWCNGADINRDGNVNYLDLSAFSEYWLGN